MAPVGGPLTTPGDSPPDPKRRFGTGVGHFVSFLYTKLTAPAGGKWRKRPLSDIPPSCAAAKLSARFRQPAAQRRSAHKLRAAGRAKAVATTPTARSDLLQSMHVDQGVPGFCRHKALWFSHLCPDQVANTDQLRPEASPTRRAMTMAGNRTPRVDKKVASILAEVLTA